MQVGRATPNCDADYGCEQEQHDADGNLRATRHATADETFNITVRNVYSRANAALRIAGAMKDCLFENIRTFDNGGATLVNDATVDIDRFFRN